MPPLLLRLLAAGILASTAFGPPAAAQDAPPLRGHAELTFLDHPSADVTYDGFSTFPVHMGGLSRDGRRAVTYVPFRPSNAHDRNWIDPFEWHNGTTRLLPEITLADSVYHLSWDAVRGVADDGALLVLKTGWVTDMYGDSYEIERAALVRNGIEMNLGLPMGFDAVYPFALSADARFAVGMMEGWWPNPSAYKPFVWRAGAGFSAVPIGTDETGVAAFVSDDGAVVAGATGSTTRELNDGLYGELFVWREGRLLRPGTIGSSPVCVAFALSGDGEVLAGRCDGGGGFWWTEEGGMVPIAEALGLPSNEVRVAALSYDGSRVVGWGEATGGLFLWDAEGGARPFWTAMREEYALPLSKAVTDNLGIDAMSSDGLTFFGASFYGDPFVLRLEETLDVLTVNRVGDEPDADLSDGLCDVDAGEPGPQCTLRAALEQVNVGTTATKIHFDLRTPDGAPLAGVPLLQPGSAYPSVMRPVRIDGTTQAAGAVHISGAAVGGSADGLTIRADSIVVTGLVVTEFPGYGLRVVGGAEQHLVRNVVGYDPTGTARPNGAGGIRVEGGAESVWVGGLDADGENRVYGGVEVAGERTRRVRVLRNRIEVPADVARIASRVPVDLGGDGPSCAPWTTEPRGPETQGPPNDALPAPRILELTPSLVRGQTLPEALVVVYRVDETGTERGRYFSRRVTPVGQARADADGAFAVPVSLGEGTPVAVVAVDLAGNTSELSQLRRPVVYVPGIGGSWLTAADETPLWIPITALTDTEKNDRLARLGMWPDGSGLEDVRVGGVLEMGGLAVYGPVLADLVAAGYAGDPENANRATNDLWRFANDWRQSAADLANGLLALVDDVTTAPDVAASCEVDLVAHSNGGMIAGVYTRAYPEHSQDHVHRLVTSGTPYLGAAQAIAGHTRGYVFGVDEAPPLNVGWDVAWGRMTNMTRHVPGAYGLLPSRGYWEAKVPDAFLHLMPDLDGRPLETYDATLAFAAANKTAGGRPVGLDRDGALWERQETTVHAHTDDWRTYEGPPQVFRHVGELPASTAVRWWLLPGPDTLAADATARNEAGDTGRHRAYRERISPILGLGDGTVPLLSATLGRDERVGGLDLSGVDESPWIEEFERFPCLHTDLVLPSCRGDGGGILDRTVTILRSGYTVTAAPAERTRAAASAREVLYVSASGPVDVHIADAEGRHTGPTGVGRAVERGVPGVVYEPRLMGAVVSLPPGRAFSVTVRSAEAGTVSVVRQRADADDDRRTALFADQAVSAGGRLLLALEAEGSPLDASLAIDGDGDGAYEAAVAPAVVAEGGGPLPVPVPAPLAVTARAGAGTDTARVALRFPDAGGEAWSWTLSDASDWLHPSATAGTAPGEAELTFDASSLPAGSYEDVLTVTVGLGAFSQTYAVPVRLVVDGAATGDEPSEPSVPGALALEAPWPNPARGTATVAFGLPAEGPVTLAVFDVLGREVARVTDGTRPAGLYREPIDLRGLSPGSYVLRLVADSEVRARSFVVVR